MTNAIRSICLASLLLGTLLALPGCYDGEQLIEEVRDQAIRSRLEEIDLGYFRTTLPRDSSSSSRIEVELELFGTAVRYKIPEIESAIEDASHRLRQAILVAIRQTTTQEMDDPSLTQLRARLLQVANTELAEAPVEELGIRKVRFIPL
ncbi:MAG: hypothetical protein ACR2NU_04020 [Aeoliella sp.]